MFKLIIIGTIAAFAAATHPVSEEMVAHIKAKTSLWQPVETDENPFANMTHEQLLAKCGTFIVPSNKEYNGSPVLKNLPANFDSRQQWGSFIHPIRDQQGCGSCWAFGATESFSDRFAISSSGTVNVILSPEDMVSCDPNDYGCNGGYMDMAWEYLEQTGVVSEGCFPYQAGSGVAPACISKCQDSEAFKKHKCVSGSIRHPTTVDEIKSEIVAHGPVEAAFTVYEDFFNYKSGVYHHVSGGVAGGHAIKILGYGVENGSNYWLAANSWGNTWGMQGFFKILQGDCSINDQIYTCDPQL